MMAMAGGYGSKIDSTVDFPLEGLDLSKYVLGGEHASTQPGEMIYDCYAVSNHFGNMGFGHYTAYAKNPIDKIWYEFDDSRVSKVNPDNVVSDAAYNLFFRKRDWHEKNMKEGIDFSKLSITPDMEWVNKK